MKIKDDAFRVERKHEIKTALRELINQPSDKDERPCPGCRFAVGAEHSLTSTDNCSFDCPHAPGQMSSDPERYPIEQGVVPLVYAFYNMRVMMPCWSCEGHMNSDGTLFKTPKLWFYTLNDFYAKLVAQYVSSLKGANKLHHHWTVTLLPFSQSMFTTTYSLEPQITANTVNLITLHQDMRVIAENLRGELHRLAHYYIERAEK